MSLGPAGGAERRVIAISISGWMRSEAHKEGQIVGLSILCTTKRMDTPYNEREGYGGEKKRKQSRERVVRGRCQRARAGLVPEDDFGTSAA
jgi:nicotinamide mononucleotide (NMN) deamidase PncC